MLRSPTWLDPLAKEFYLRWIPALKRDGIYCDSNAELIATICQHYSAYRTCEALIQKEGRLVESAAGTLKAHPAVAMSKNYWDSFCRGMRELGVNSREMDTYSDDLDEFSAG